MSFLYLYLHSHGWTNDATFGPVVVFVASVMFYALAIWSIAE